MLPLKKPLNCGDKYANGKKGMDKDNNELFYDRNKLYSEVWEYTLSKLCKQYKVSHSELVKACEILNVPRPYVGYWTQKELGKAPQPSMLPPFDNPPHLQIHPSTLEKKTKPLSVKKVVSKKLEQKPKQNKDETKTIQIVLPDNENSELKLMQASIKNSVEPTVPKIFNWQSVFPQKGCLFPQAFEKAGKLIEKEKLPEMAITVPEKTKKEHPYVKNTRINLEKKHKGLTKNSLSYSDGLFSCYGKQRFRLNISPDSFERVFNLLQALCNAFEKRGFDLISEPSYYSQYETYVLIMGKKLRFSIKEELEKVSLEKIDRQTYLDHKFIPTGKLTFINQSRPYKMEFKNSWSDTNESPLEDNLNDIIAGLICTSVWIKENAEIEKREEEKEKRAEALKREKERLAKQEKQRVTNFKKAAEYWEQYQSMRAFFNTVKKAHRKSGQKNNDTKKWIQWARGYLANYKTMCENLIVYEVREYDEQKENTVYNRPSYDPPSQEPYNYWKKPWYQKR